jgi:hypothetical protein
LFLIQTFFVWLVVLRKRKNRQVAGCLEGTAVQQLSSSLPLLWNGSPPDLAANTATQPLHTRDITFLSSKQTDRKTKRTKVTIQRSGKFNSFYSAPNITTVIK